MVTVVAPAPAITDDGLSEVTTGTELLDGVGVGVGVGVGAALPPPQATIIKPAIMQ